MNLLHNKLVLITGGSKGIGKAMAELFAQNGANLVLLSRDINKLKDIQLDLIDRYKISVEIFQCDIRVPDDIKSVFDKLGAEKKYINVLVNNAGIMIDATLQVVKPEIINAIYETNVYGTMYASQFALKHFVRNRGGSIINLSSIIGTHGNLGQTVYGSSKTAVIGFTKSLSKELSALNIRVNAIAPGFIDTDMTKGMDPKFYEKNLASIGMRRLGKPEDVAKTALFLASDLSEYVTGQVIGVDGGMII